MRVTKSGDQGPREGSPRAWDAGVGHDSVENLHGKHDWSPKTRLDDKVFTRPNSQDAADGTVGRVVAATRLVQ